MDLLLSILFTLGYTWSWIKFQQYQFLERDYNIVGRYPKYSKNWHYWKGINQIVFFSILTFTFGWQLALINSIIFWILFDGIFNKIVLKREFFYVGKTAQTDKTIRKFLSWVNTPYNNKITSENFSAFIKFLLLTISILICIWVK